MRDGEIVWEFFNPDVKEDDQGDSVRGTIYRMTRLPEALVSRLLNSTAQSATPR